MKKLIDWIDKEHSEGLYELMTNQIYTAVLGSIIYMFFDWGFNVYMSTEPVHDAVFRTLFLIVGIGFYLSDFYYIKGSKPYRKWYFVFDLIFMGCMLYSTKLLGVDSQSMNSKLSVEELTGIIRGYMLFLVLYLLWDFREMVAIWNKNKEQKPYYWEVILWEILTLIALYFVSRLEENKALTILFTLSLSTVWFCFLTYRKSTHTANRIHKLFSN